MSRKQLGFIGLVALAAIAYVVMKESEVFETPGRAAAAGPSHWQQGSTTMIRVAYSPDIAPLFQSLAEDYNRRQRTYGVQATGLELEEALAAATAGSLAAISPDSSLVLNDLERAWRERSPQAPPLVGHTVRFAASPVVIAVQEAHASRVDGWQGLLRSGLKWSHLSSLSTSSGLLALAAEFYAAAGTEKIDRADVDRKEVLDRVAAIEKSIARYGGESEEKVVDYLLTAEGRAAIEAIVLSEAQVVALNQRTARQNQGRWQAVYPVEGTVMMDHPLTLLEHPTLAPEARRAFLDFARYLATPEALAQVVQHGYRPTAYQADLSGGPITPQNGADPRQPRLLALPSPGTLLAMRDYWATGLKRGANILLIVDLSGSMEEDGKLGQAKRALEAFVTAAAKTSGRNRVGLDGFSSDYKELVPMAPLAQNQEALVSTIRGLKSGGDTALFYAAWAGQQKMLLQQDTERINAVVLMTDGLENRSGNHEGQSIFGRTVPKLGGGGRSALTLARELAVSQRGQPAQVLIFTVGYGKDADSSAMRAIATAAGGQFYLADTATIARLYPLISENF